MGRDGVPDPRTVVRLGLDLLKPHLRTFVERQLRRVYGPDDERREPRLTQGAEPDIQVLLYIILDHWDPVFSRTLQPSDRGLVHELRHARNRWAHEESVSLDQAYRVLDTIELFLASIRVTAEKEQIEALKQEIRLRQVGAGPGVARAAPPPTAPAGRPIAAPPQTRDPAGGKPSQAAGLGWLGEEGDRLRAAFKDVFSQSPRPFGNRPQHIGGLSDGNQGVQWNAAYDPRDGRRWVGVNLEGLKYGDWPVARLLERELKKPSLLELVRKHPDIGVVEVLWRREYWQASSRPPIREGNIAPTPIALARLTESGWRAALRDALQCLDPARNHRGRSVQTVTLASGTQLEGRVSPHLTFEYLAGGSVGWEEFFREAKERMQPLYEWAVGRSA